MPFALPFIPVAVSEIIIPALGVVAATVLGWYLSRPHGKISWSAIVSWAETNIKAPVEWVFEGIKDRFWETARAFHNLYWGVRYYTEKINDFVTNTRTHLREYVRDYAEAVANNVIEARKAVTRRIWQSLHGLEDYVNWIRFTLIKWIRQHLEAKIAEVYTDLVWLKKATANSVNRLWEQLDSVRTGLLTLGMTLVEGITTDVLPNIDELTKDLARKLAKATGLGAIFTAIGAWIATLVNSIAKPLQAEMDFLERQELDWLLVAYLAYTKPVVIDRAPEVLNTLLESFSYIKKASLR